MSDSTTRDILDGLETALAFPNGAGAYHFDLTGNDQIHVGGMDWPPPRLPAAVMLDASISSSHSATQIGRYLREISVPIIGFAAVGDNTNRSRFLNAADLADDLLRCIEIGRDDATGVFAVAGVRDVLTSTARVAASELVLGEPGYALVFFTVTVTYQVDRGA